MLYLDLTFYAVLFGINLLMLIGCLVCALLALNGKANRQKPQCNIIKVEPTVKAEKLSVDETLDNITKQLDYLTSNGITPEIASLIVNELNSVDRRNCLKTDDQKKLNVIMNRLLQFAVKNGKTSPTNINN